MDIFGKKRIDKTDEIKTIDLYSKMLEIRDLLDKVKTQENKNVFKRYKLYKHKFNK